MATYKYESDNTRDNEQRRLRPDSNGDTAVNIIESYAGDGTPGGTFIQHEFQNALAVAKDVTVNHDIIINDGEIAELHQLNVNASGLAEFELLIGDGAVSEVFTTKELIDTSTINIHIIPYQRPIIVVGTVNGLTIRVAKTNLANQSQDLSSKLILVIR